MKKLPFLLALAAAHLPIRHAAKDPFADRDAIEKAQQKRARRAEKLAAKEASK